MAIPATTYDIATATNPSSALTDFTFMIDLSRMSAAWWAGVNTSDGTRGRASKSDGTTELATDWIDFNDSAETGWLRAKYTGILASSGTQEVRVYPPNTVNSAYAVGDTYGQYNAYDSNKKLYMPLEEDPSGSAPQMFDRTSNGNNGTTQGSMTSGDSVAAQVENGLDLDGTDDYISVSSSASLDLTGGFYTLSMWVNLDASQTNWAGLLIKGVNEWGLQRNSGTTNLDVRHSDSVAAQFSGAWGLISGVGQIKLDVTYDTTANEVKLYLDGVLSDTQTATTDPSHSTGALLLGASRDPIEINGIIDEIHIESIDRSAAFISEEFDQTNDNATFWGTWTNVPAGGDLAIAADSGTYSTTGTDASILAERFINAESGTYSLVGTDVDFIIISDAFITAEAGTYSLSGFSVATIADKIINADSGSYSLVGTDVDFIIISEAIIEANSGVFSWVGSAAILIKGDNQVPEYGGLMGIDTLDELKRFEFNKIDLGIAIATGELNGVGRIEKYGKNAAAATGEVVQDEGGPIVFQTVAGTIELISTSADDDVGGVGAEAFLIAGVDADWNPIEELIVTNGLTVSLSSSKSFLYVFRAKMMNSGAVRNIGTITIRKSGAGATLAQVSIGAGQTQRAVFPVPAGCSLYMNNFRLEGTKNAALTGEVDLMEYQLGEGIRVAHPISFSAGAPGNVEWTVGTKKFTEKTLVWVEVAYLSVEAVITASFDGVLVRETDTTPA
jgi:hypothetical protein